MGSCCRARGCGLHVGGPGGPVDGRAVGWPLGHRVEWGLLRKETGWGHSWSCTRVDTGHVTWTPQRVGVMKKGKKKKKNQAEDQAKVTVRLSGAS